MRRYLFLLLCLGLSTTVSSGIVYHKNQPEHACLVRFKDPYREETIVIDLNHVRRIYTAMDVYLHIRTSNEVQVADFKDEDERDRVFGVLVRRWQECLK